VSENSEGAASYSVILFGTGHNDTDPRRWYVSQEPLPISLK
jgi:hypothetical protein